MLDCKIPTSGIINDGEETLKPIVIAKIFNRHTILLILSLHSAGCGIQLLVVDAMCLQIPTSHVLSHDIVNSLVGDLNSLVGDPK